MQTSYQFTGLTRTQFSLVLVISLLLGFTVGFLILFGLIKYFIFNLGMNGHSNNWLMPAIFGSVFVSAVLVSCASINLFSRKIKKIWKVQVSTNHFSIQDQNMEPLYLPFSQLNKIQIRKVKALAGFNQSIELIFDSKKVDFQIVTAPILSASKAKDKTQFLLFLNYVYSHVIEQQFELVEKTQLMSSILAILVDEALIEHKFTFIKKL